MNVSITPGLLEFKAPFTNPSTELITITNDSDDTIAFKVKTTAPKLYCVRPNAALVHPGQTMEVSIILLGLKEEPTPDYKCNDKFLIVALPAPYDLGDATVADKWAQLEAEFKPQSLSKKIKVKYVFDKTSNHSTTTTTTSATGGSGDVQNDGGVIGSSQFDSNEKSTIHNEDLSPEERNKIDALNEKLDSNVAASKSTTTTTSSSSQKITPAQSSSIPITTVILFAIIAFIIAWLFF